METVQLAVLETDDFEPQGEPQAYASYRLLSQSNFHCKQKSSKYLVYKIIQNLKLIDGHFVEKMQHVAAEKKTSKLKKHYT